MSHQLSHDSRYCHQCGKANQACICEYIVSIDASVELIILQHESEQNHPLGSARILDLSLARTHLFIGEDFSQHEQLNLLLADKRYQHAILYPSELAVDLTQFASQIAPEMKYRVILLDGTWKKAYKMWQLSKNLHSVPCVALPKSLKGEYQIRKAPSDNALSTVEAGYHALSILEPNTNFVPLVDAFKQMIQFQIDQMPPGVFERNYLSK
ncbi:tRNA-uridine aminocarboxypropyltransferase [Vibrio agarivorans]|uniref:tRNA-uridine aminocarboxypropyltransferase n=1 Tax=Vibrio agarivorans TaxID=153622 RepID=UPI0025B37077|nr:DTW domain-containing protein [Vibrio agarivorans]MDN3662898.1 DTW domain-containing protein [Vibrio agarivorans]